MILPVSTSPQSRHETATFASSRPPRSSGATKENVRAWVLARQTTGTRVSEETAMTRGFRRTIERAAGYASDRLRLLKHLLGNFTAFGMLPETRLIAVGRSNRADAVPCDGRCTVTRRLGPGQALVRVRFPATSCRCRRSTCVCWPRWPGGPSGCLREPTSPSRRVFPSMMPVVRCGRCENDVWCDSTTGCCRSWGRP